MKQFTLKSLLLVLTILMGGVNAWGETGSLTFGSNNTKINSPSVTASDNLGNSWTITTDGTTLLGADDKAGIAEIMTAIDYLKQHPEFESIRNLIRCICLNIKLPNCKYCGKPISYSRRKRIYCLRKRT